MNALSVRTAVHSLGSQQRVGRYPKHRFRVNHRPYQLQPFLIAPVLPGETMKKATLQARAKTDALAADADMLGWWLEHYLFYVKLTDLVGREDFTEMLMDATKDMSAHDTAANAKTYHSGYGVDWTQLCLDRIVDEYFRDEGDAPALFDGLPIVSIEGNSLFDSVMLDSEVSSTDDYLPGEEMDVVPDKYASFGAQYAQWKQMQEMKLVTATFEDYLKAYGVKPDTQPDRVNYKPELIRYSREWQYPSTVVHSGSTTSAVVWSVAESADKDRLFKEPGFIVGVTCARPKVYLGKQTGAGAGLMNDAYAWLPATMQDAPFTSLKQFAAVAAEDGPLGALPTEAYWIDLRDLLIYGDQFHNMAGTEAGFAALPTASVERRYAAEAEIDAMFADAVGGSKYIHQDGVVNFSILSHQRDTT